MTAPRLQWENEREEDASNIVGQSPLGVGTLGEDIANKAWFSVALDAPQSVSGAVWTCFSDDWCPSAYEMWALEESGTWARLFSEVDVTPGNRLGRPLVTATFSPFVTTALALVYPDPTIGGTYWHSIREFSITLCDTYEQQSVDKCPVDASVQYNANSGALNPTGGATSLPLGDHTETCSPAADGRYLGTPVGGGVSFEQFNGFTISSNGGNMNVGADGSYTVRVVVQFSDQPATGVRVLNIPPSRAGIFIRNGLEYRTSGGTVISPTEAAVVTTGSWHSITVATDASGAVDLYLDGIRLASWEGLNDAVADPLLGLVLFNDYGDVLTPAQCSAAAAATDSSSGVLHSAQVFGRKLARDEVMSLETCTVKAEEFYVGSPAGCYGGSKPGLRDVSFTADDGSVRQMRVFCDPATDGGGWMLLMAYAHEGGQDLPLVASADPPTSPLTGYSHTTLTQVFGDAFDASNVDAVRFRCTTQTHRRLVHFTSTAPNVIATALTGAQVSTPSDWQASALLSDHTGNLPANADAAGAAADGAFWDLPFSAQGGADRFHWAARAAGAEAGQHRWECDEPQSGSGSDVSTNHQVWVKLKPGVLQEAILDPSTDPRSCREILEADNTARSSSEAGFYTIRTPATDADGGSLEVYCDMSTDGGGYTYYEVNDGVSVSRVRQAAVSSSSFFANHGLRRWTRRIRALSLGCSFSCGAPSRTATPPSSCSASTHSRWCPVCLAQPPAALLPLR